ncbi:EamA family transporter [Polynucleobacter sp. Fuers-14]|uniref:EamA family transporter n=1 Tax=Polynucleobacter sp. Fuers-14 TaxID=1758364 RepID=UPI001C0B0223|nr:EamA family transporter [Polynucleobacter sp. Fuers-14]MBU3641074.1 EamA family transporter [Polynucleobacter sp. Fuers-14]
MSLTNFLIILVGVLLNAFAQISLKFGSNAINNYGAATDISGFLLKFFNLPIVLGLICYGFSVISWIYALTRVEVSVAYPMLSIGYIVVALLASFFFGEHITYQKIGAMSVIIVGVFLMSRAQ